MKAQVLADFITKLSDILIPGEKPERGKWKLLVDGCRKILVME